MIRSMHSLTHTKLVTMNMGYLVPIGIQRIEPGDTEVHSTSALVRFNPMVTPPMHPTHAETISIFVQWRLIWDDFENWYTGGRAGTSAPTFPTVSLGGADNEIGSLADYLGSVPNDLADGPAPDPMVTSVLPFRAYAKAVNDHCQDPLLSTPLVFSTASGLDTTTNLDLALSLWEKDPFTTCTPEPQLGPEVVIPLANTAPVITPTAFITTYEDAAGGNPSLLHRNQFNVVGQTPTPMELLGEEITARPASAGVDSGSGNTSVAAGIPLPGDMYADLSASTGIPYSVLARSFALQRFQTNMNVYGSEYTDRLRYLGVQPQDGRLGRSEILGRSKQVVQFSEVLQTAEGTDPVGTMAGHGLGYVKTGRYKKEFHEHGYVIHLMTIRPTTMYTQGMPYHWDIRTKDQVFQPEFANLSDQEVTYNQIYAGAADPTATWGYRPRYDELRHEPNTISGQFHSIYNSWHMARIFTTEPVLNEEFVTNLPTKRIFAVTDPDIHAVLVMVRHTSRMLRLVPKRSNVMIK